VTQETKESSPGGSGTEQESGGEGPDHGSSSPLGALRGLFEGGDGGGGGLESLVATHRTKLIWAGSILVVLALMGLSPLNPGRVLVSGVREGAVYALVGLGLALIYTSTRVLNFAQGEFGSTAAYVVVAVIVGGNLGRDVNPDEVTATYMIGMALVAIIVGAGLAVAINLFIIRRLNSAFASLVATAALFVLLQGSQFVIFGARRTFPRIVEGNAFALFGTQISYQEVFITVVLVTVAVLLAGLFRTPLGVALLASAQEPYAASLYGVSPKAMSSLAWGTAGALGGVAGLLAGGIFRGIEPGFMTTDYLIPAFTGAVLGGITSMTGAVVGALLLGLTVAAAQQLVTAYQLDAYVPNAPIASSFLVLLIVLAVRPTGLLGKDA
jgi:branched-chain amino acid transport system permease protein